MLIRLLSALLVSVLASACAVVHPCAPVGVTFASSDSGGGEVQPGLRLPARGELRAGRPADPRNLHPAPLLPLLAALPSGATVPLQVWSRCPRAATDVVLSLQGHLSSRSSRGPPDRDSSSPES